MDFDWINYEASPPGWLLKLQATIVREIEQARAAAYEEGLLVGSGLTEETSKVLSAARTYADRGCETWHTLLKNAVKDWQDKLADLSGE